MNVFLTGATGLVGAHTALELLKNGHHVRMLVRNRGVAERWFAKYGLTDLDFIEGDMLDSAVVERGMQGCDTVVHAAAVIDLDARNKDATQSKNVQGVDNVIGQACRAGISKILYISSISAVFNAKLTELDENQPVSVNRDPYSRSKALCEQKVRDLQAQGYPIIITYPSGIFGPDDPKMSQSNEGLMLLFRDFIPHTSSGMQFIDVRDLAKANRLLLEVSLSEDKTQERYMFGGHFLTWREFSRSLQNLNIKKIRTIIVPGVVFRVLGFALDGLRKFVPINYPITYESALIVTQMPPCNSQKLLAKTGMQFTPAEQTLKDTIEWLYQEKHL